MAWLQDIAINTLWYNNGAGNDPSGDTPPTNVVNGAVAVNTADGLMWVKVTNGDVTGGWKAVGGVPNPVTVALGGTGVQTLTQNGVLIGNGTDAVTAVDLSTAGSLLIGDGSVNPSALAKGANDTVLTTNGSGVVGWVAPAAAGNSFGTVAVGSQSNVVADQAADTLTLVASTGMTITTSASADSITFVSSGGHTHSSGTDETFRDIYVRDIIDANSESQSVSGVYLNTIKLNHSNTEVFISQFYTPPAGGNLYKVKGIEINAYTAGNLNSQTGHGSLAIGGNASETYGLYLHGPKAAFQTFASTSWAIPSDERLKTNTASLTGATAKIKALNPISFQWSAAYRGATSLSDETNIGYLANEYATVFPNDITTTTSDLIQLSNGSYATGEYTPKVASAKGALPTGATVSVANIKNINPDSVVPYLVVAFKELEARVIVLEAE